MPRSHSHGYHKSSRSYSRDREYKRRSSSDDDYYLEKKEEKKKSYRRSRSPSSSSRSKKSHKSTSRRRSNSSSENDYNKKKKPSKSHKEKKSKKSKRSYRSPSSTSGNDSTESEKSVSSQRKPTAQIDVEKSDVFNLNLLEGKINTQTIDEIDEDTFQQKAFSSSSSSRQTSQKVYIDLKKDTILVPTSEVKEVTDDSIFHPNFLGDETQKNDKWVKKLFNYRRRLI